MFKFLKVILICLIYSLVACKQEGKKDRSNQSAKEKEYYDGKGIGPVSELKLDLINPELAEKGEQLFISKCSACHKWSDEKGIGPGLKGVTLRRRPEWIMNQILDPMGMTKKDSLARELLAIYQAQMTPMNLSMEEARNILEFFRKEDGGNTN